MAEADTAQPSRATLVQYVRLNLAIAVALFSLASGIFGASITATVKIVSAQRDIEAISDRLDRFDKLAEKRQLQWDKQADTNASIDRRLVVLEEIAKWRVQR